ncbi:hypothetical protein AN958_11788 [Leucoagaricus sp. SymC.cos]|nr:hypothetical protein AN958_11788 [Leucoagaricus sp. SymC.cos]
MDRGTGMDKREADVFSTTNGWKTGKVEVKVPIAGTKYSHENSVPVYEVGGVHHCSLVEVIWTAFQDPGAEAFHYLHLSFRWVFHYIPFKLFWNKTPDSPSECVITELYNSDAFIKKHEKLQRQSPEPGYTHERAVAALILWLDSMHLANFGNASLWPIYCYFGNQSKYTCAKPTSFTAYHLAYIPSNAFSTFSTQVRELRFDYHHMFMPDLLHEFELGTWKATFIHLICILLAAGDGPVQELNCSCHLIPAYAHGQVSWLGPSLIHCVVDDHHDWQYYYANIFVDCDMFMRYQGGGVGYGLLALNTNQSNPSFPTYHHLCSGVLLPHGLATFLGLLADCAIHRFRVCDVRSLPASQLGHL